MSAAVNLLVLVLIIVGAVGGLVRGVRRELLNLAGLGAAFLGGILLAKPVSILFRRWGVIEELPYLLAFVIGFIAASLAFSFLKGPFVPREIDTGERMAGGALGLGKGLVAAALLLYLLVGAFPDSLRTVKAAPVSRYVLPLTPAVDTAAGLFGRLLPEEFTGRVREGYRRFRAAGRDITEAFDALEQAAEKADAIAEGIGALSTRPDSGSTPPPRAPFR